MPESKATPQSAAATQKAAAQQRRISTLLGPVIIVLILAVFWLPQFLNKGAAATVNGENISHTELDRRVAFERQWNQWNGNTLPTAGAEANQFRAQVLNTMVENRLVLQEAKKQAMTASTQEVDAQIAAMQQQLNLADAQMTADLTKAGLTRQTVEGVLREDIVVSKYMNVFVLKGIAQADQETAIRNWYNTALSKAHIEKRIETGGARVGKPAPDFTLNGLDGKAVRLSDFKGKPVFINFFATWCTPCRQEMPDLETVWKANQNNGLVVLEINLTDQDTVADVQKFVKEFGLTMPIVLDEKGMVSTLYRVGPIPSSYFVSKDGTLVAVQVGSMSRATMDQRIAKIMQ